MADKHYALRKVACECGNLKDSRAKTCIECFKNSFKIEQKECNSCGIILDIEEYAFRKADPKGRLKRRSNCKGCESKYASERRKQFPEKWKEIKKKWEVDNPEKVMLGQLRRSAVVLGLDSKYVEEQYCNHHGLCDSCGRDAKSISRFKRLFIDHDHKTGKFRGFLCTYCNIAAGQMKDDPDMLRKLAAYLERYMNLDASGD